VRFFLPFLRFLFCIITRASAMAQRFFAAVSRGPQAQSQYGGCVQPAAVQENRSVLAPRLFARVLAGNRIVLSFCFWCEFGVLRPRRTIGWFQPSKSLSTASQSRACALLGAANQTRPGSPCRATVHSSTAHKEGLAAAGNVSSEGNSHMFAASVLFVSEIVASVPRCDGKVCTGLN
jgi:hypothetical protein